MSKRLFSILSLMIVQLSLGMLFAQEAFEVTENFKRVGRDNMEYNRNYKQSNNTHRVKTMAKKAQDIKSFNIPGEKYEDSRRVVSRKFR